MLRSNSPIARSSTRISDTLAAELESRILEGSLKPGDRLPSERDLAVELGVSRPSLREAIQKLVSKGLVVTRHGGGTVVTDRLDAQFVDPWQQMLLGHPNLQGDLLEFRHMLEGEAAMLASERATDADSERIQAAFMALDSAYEGTDLNLCIDCDVAFHQAIADASHNALIAHLNASLMRVIHGHVTSNLAYLRARPMQWLQLRLQHRAIWEAIRDRQSDVALRMAREHIEFVRQSMAETAKAEERLHSARRRLGEAV
jgi:GntR family transcriptional repressor for pyruvate dehydrogenase complex